MASRSTGGPLTCLMLTFGDTQITDWAIEKTHSHMRPVLPRCRLLPSSYPLLGPERFFDRFADSSGELPPIKDDDLDDLSRFARKWALEPDHGGQPCHGCAAPAMAGGH